MYSETSRIGEDDVGVVLERREGWKTEVKRMDVVRSRQVLQMAGAMRFLDRAANQTHKSSHNSLADPKTEIAIPCTASGKNAGRSGSMGCCFSLILLTLPAAGTLLFLDFWE